MTRPSLAAALTVLFGFVGMSSSASAIVLAEYDLLPASGTSLAVTSTAPGVTASALTLTNPANTAAAFSNHFYHNGWGASIDLGKFYELTLDAAGYQLTTVDFSLEEISGAPSEFALRTSADGFGADVGAGLFSGGLVTDFSVDLSSLGVLTGPLSLRWYMTADSLFERAGFANHELGGAGGGLSDVGLDLFINGIEVPEPGTLTLLTIGLAGLGMVARRRRAC